MTRPSLFTFCGLPVLVLLTGGLAAGSLWGLTDNPLRSRRIYSSLPPDKSLKGIGEAEKNYTEYDPTEQLESPSERKHVENVRQ
jgi:hypothetical protein